MTEYFPLWLQERIGPFMPFVRILVIILVALLLRRLAVALIKQLSTRSVIPNELVIGLRRVTTFLIYATALLLILEGLGVSATVLWTAFTGFAAVAAVAFFAAWSVLSNIFCTLLIVVTRPFRLHDEIELVENGEQRGLRGEVIDVNFIYTTLKETTAEGQAASVLQIPNSLFFQRVLRRCVRR
jgi:small-conductance mechanosensitive channel